MKETRYKEFLFENNLNYNMFIDKFTGFSRINDSFYVLSEHYNEDTLLWNENQTSITKDELREFMKNLHDFVENYNE